MHRWTWTAALLALTLGSRANAESPWVSQSSGTTERLRGVAAIDDRTVWASGNHGTCVRTTDGGRTWQQQSPSNTADLDFRDVAALDDHHAYLLAIGPGDRSQIHRTHDGGQNWYRVYRNEDPRRFLDAIAFWDVDHGLALSDPVDGRFVILATDDGGKHWEEPSGPGTMPAALPNEGAFAASGTCLIINPQGHAWFATGGAATARVFRSTDRGRSWTVAETPVRAGAPSRGIFTLATRGEQLVALGGDYKAETDGTAVFARSLDGGQNWINDLASQDRAAFRSAAVFVPEQAEATLLSVGPAGTDIQVGTQRWRSLGEPIERDGWHALAIAPSGSTAWAVGEGGRIGKLDLTKVKGP